MSILDPAETILKIGGKLLDRILPDPEQRDAAKLEMLKLQQSGELEELTLFVQDRDSARKREIGVKDSTNRILAFAVIGGFLALVCSTLLGYAKVDNALAGTLVGYLSAKAEQVLAYYFGSSQGSAQKTELLARSQPVDTTPP